MGNKINMLGKKKIDFMYWIDFKLLNQIKGNPIKYCYFFKFINLLESLVVINRPRHQNTWLRHWWVELYVYSTCTP
jgi:hypothetical protein